MAVELLTPENEELVFLDRATNLVPDVIVAIYRRGVARRCWWDCDRWIQLTVLVEPLVGVQALIAMEEATIAVPLVGATLGDNSDLSAGGLAKLGLVI